MQLTPSQAFEHIKESVVEYLETAYKIAHPAVFSERGEILRARGTVAQAPFIEATPAFPTADKLADLEQQYGHAVPTGLAELVNHGVPVGRFPLYTHQQTALLVAATEQPHLLIGTGTGSGKTEAFLLPILADLMKEARMWAVPHRLEAVPGRYNAVTRQWESSRRYEERPAALRAIIPYPMNALVNDQLSRLRRILARGTSPTWQRTHLNGNVIHFGMYTGLSEPTGSWTDEYRRTRFSEYLKQIREDWDKLREDLRDTGGWPRPDSPEMLCRWDMQLAPPDIMVTNYSMLEYMLVRPIEAPIFAQTRAWLESTPQARLTLVVDEAHTYTGAKGTEVAYLIRRLKERLGIEPESPQFRAIATTASVPATADRELHQFISDLFGEPARRFTLVRIDPETRQVPDRQPTAAALHAFAHFHRCFDLQNPQPAIAQLAADLDGPDLDPTIDPQVALYNLLESHPDVTWVRQRTARNATLIDLLSTECWGTLGTAAEREEATAGVLAAGSFARAVPQPDTPPLLSMRVHAFFRGIPGIWACMNPQCPEMPVAQRALDRPVGKLYLDPRPWCSPACGSRVLEVFSCRHCGLLFLGGIPAQVSHSLWPWSDTLTGERQDLQQFRIFGVERPHIEAQPTTRSLRTTLPAHPADNAVRAVYELPAVDEDTPQTNPFPQRCPRCQDYRVPQREVIEPLRTKGPRTFSIIAEDGFRVQPRNAHGQAPNYGRKALLFSDSRMDAAQLAGDLRNDHHADLFRQLTYRALHTCPTCAGSGQHTVARPYRIGQPRATRNPAPPVGAAGAPRPPARLTTKR